MALTDAQRRALFAKFAKHENPITMPHEIKLTRAAQNRLMTKAQLATTLSKKRSRGDGFPTPSVTIKPRPPGDVPSLASRRFPKEKVDNLPLMRPSDILSIRDPIARKALFARREGLSIDDPLISERGFNA